MSKQQTAVIAYRYKGRRCMAYVKATDWDDAEERVRALRTTGKLYGWPSFSAPSHKLLLPISILWLRFRTWVWKRWGI